MEASDAKTNPSTNTTTTPEIDSSPRGREAADREQEQQPTNRATRPQNKPGDAPETISESPDKQTVAGGADSLDSGEMAGRGRSDSDKRVRDRSSTHVNQAEVCKNILSA